MSLRIWRFVSLYLTAITLALTFAHLLEMPQKMQYGEALYLSVQHSLYLYFAWVGAFAESGAVIALIALSFQVRRRPGIFGPTLLAAVCVAAGLAVWFGFVSTANTKMAEWRGIPLPPDWMAVRRQWEWGHAASAVLDLIGFAALLISVLVDTKPYTQKSAGAAGD